jgi:hypothetical protein
MFDPGGLPAAGPGAAGPGSPFRRVSWVRRALIPLAAFGLGVGVAELAGAENLGTAFGVGQIAFALTLVGVLLR